VEVNAFEVAVKVAILVEVKDDVFAVVVKVAIIIGVKDEVLVVDCSPFLIKCLADA